VPGFKGESVLYREELNVKESKRRKRGQKVKENYKVRGRGRGSHRPTD